MVGAGSAVQGQMGDFASTFAPISDDTEEIEILIDILGAGFSLISAGVWNKGRLSCGNQNDDERLLTVTSNQPGDKGL